MSAPVRYRCPRCGSVGTVQRDGYLADESVTPDPLEGWTYARPGGGVESADGVRLLSGESAAVEWAGEGCGEPFYRRFVRFEDGEVVVPVPESEFVETAGPDPRRPSGPRGPSGRG